MYIFNYTPDGMIYRNGSMVGSYPDFVVRNPDFPITGGQYFEYSNDGFDLINSVGHHDRQTGDDLARFQTLITAINNLGE